MADEKSDEVIEGKLVHSFGLSNLPSYHGALSWSSDDRISIITDQHVYIITLLLSEDSSKANVKYHISTIPAKTDHHFYVDFKSGLDMRDFDKDDSLDGIAVKRVLSFSSRPDRNSGVNFNAFQSASWSPIGCDVHGRCILATLCLDNRLSLYMTNKYSKNWTEAACISKQWYKHCQKECFPGINEKLRTHKKKHKKKLTSQAVAAMSTIEMDYIDHVSIACFTWYPVLINSNDKNPDFLGNVHQFAILAAATKDGKITFWQVSVPISCDKADVALVDCDVQCSVLEPCSLSWCNTDTNKGLVAVGGVNGKIEVINVSMTVNSESKVNINKISQHLIWNDADDLAVNFLSWLTTTQQQENKTVVAAKGSTLIQFTFTLDDDQTVQEFNNSVINCDHLSFICGMSVTQDGRVFTCDSDSSVNMIDVGTKQVKEVECHLKPFHIRRGLAVSPNGLFVALFLTPSIYQLQDRGAYKQVEILVVSLVSEETLSKAITQVGRGSMWDIQTGMYQHFSQNDPPKEGPIAEFLEQPLKHLSLSSLHVRYRFADHFSSQLDESFTANDSSLDVSDGRDWKQEAKDIGKEIVKTVMTSSLKVKLENHRDSELSDRERRSLLIMSDWLVMNYSDPVTLDLALQVYSVTNDHDSITLATQIRQNGIMGKMSDVDPLKCDIQEGEGANEGDDEPSSKRQKSGGESSLALSCREQCLICQSNIPLVSLTSGQCANGHAWKRCVVTFCVCADYIYHRCQDCGNSISLIGEDESLWLQELLGKSRVCCLCRGWQDSRQ